MTSDKARSDPLLEPFLRAHNESEREKHLVQLMEVQAGPVMQQVLRRKFKGDAEGSGDFDDVLSVARTELVRRLESLREGTSEESIANFRAYASSVAYTAWAEHLRHAYPARSMLLNRLRYLLENRTKQQGFVLWDGVTGERWCGLEKHRAENPGPAAPKLQRLIVEPTKTAREAMGEIDFQTIDLATLLTRLFEWLEQPIELRQLIDVMGELRQISDHRQSLEVTILDQSEPRDLSPSPVEAMKWREYLRWLWEEIARLSRPQRLAFVLHSNVTMELEILGIASIRKIAVVLEIPAEEMAQLWNRIPVDDLAIAELLGQQRQQVINLRRVARDRLGVAWTEWAK
jgi:hypothetical protein